MRGRASGTPPPRPTLLLPPPALSRSNFLSEVSGSRCSASLKIKVAQGLRGMDLGVCWGNGCGVLRACSGAPFIHGGGQTGALARADLTGAHGGANGTERERRGVGLAELVGDGRARLWSFQGRRRSLRATWATAWPRRRLHALVASRRTEERGALATFAVGKAMVCGAADAGVVASWTAWRSDGRQLSREHGSGGRGSSVVASDRERGEREMTCGVQGSVRGRARLGWVALAPGGPSLRKFPFLISLWYKLLAFYSFSIHFY